jgi:serine protease AprX
MRNTDGRAADVRSSALWGTGSRGGEHRSDVLRGRRGRAWVTTAVALVALALPMAATAGGNGDHKRGWRGDGSDKSAYVDPSLLEGAKKNPDKKIRVIIRAKSGSEVVEQAFNKVGKSGKGNGVGMLTRRLNSVGGIAVELPAARVEALSKIPYLEITPDAPVHVTGLTTKQLWPLVTGTSFVWPFDATLFGSKTPAIAIVDSGIEARPDFGSRIVADVKMSSLADTAGDSRGHGTFVAAIAAGAGLNYAGVAPSAKLVSVDVMDATGMARTSDVIAACEWILANKTKYNIRVANFSLHSARTSSALYDPLDRAVEKLWFNGIFVVAAAGNYGSESGPSGVRSAPGNDPFVMTVGALDSGNTVAVADDTVAPWSAWGYTPDGFSKPEVVAPGRYMVAAVPDASTLVKERADKKVAPGYMQLSGTSFSAPVVAGLGALILALHPNWTPDQVKGAVMASARAVRTAPLGAAGVGEVTVPMALMRTSVPNPNAPLNRFIVPDPAGGSTPMFDAAAWMDAASSDAAWASAAWSDAAWSDAAWSSAAWASAAWSDAAWASAAWSDAAWSDAAWADAAWADASEADQLNLDAATASPLDEAAAAADPALGFTP